MRARLAPCPGSGDSPSAAWWSCFWTGAPCSCWARCCPTSTSTAPAGAFVTAVIAAVLNALVWPTLSRLALPLSVLTLGGAALVLNGGLVAVAAAISPGASIDGWFAGVVVAVGMTVITTAASALLAIDDDETWQRNVLRRQARRAGGDRVATSPGVLFLEIDGLAHEVLRRALRDGNAPAWRAGCARHATGWSAGRPTGPRRPAPARRACCTATTTTCRPSAGGRRTAAARS